ncbi:MAG: hypothetical protein ACKVN9_10855 [Methylophilaceae bacterium]
MSTERTQEENQYHFHVLKKIKLGQTDIAEGRSYSHDDALQRLDKWLLP